MNRLIEEFGSTNINLLFRWYSFEFLPIMGDEESTVAWLKSHAPSLLSLAYQPRGIRTKEEVEKELWETREVIKRDWYTQPLETFLPVVYAAVARFVNVDPGVAIRCFFKMRGAIRVLVGFNQGECRGWGVRWKKWEMQIKEVPCQTPTREDVNEVVSLLLRPRSWEEVFSLLCLNFLFSSETSMGYIARKIILQPPENPLVYQPQVPGFSRVFIPSDFPTKYTGVLEAMEGETPGNAGLWGFVI